MTNQWQGDQGSERGDTGAVRGHRGTWPSLEGQRRLFWQRASTSRPGGENGSNWAGVGRVFQEEGTAHADSESYKAHRLSTSLDICACMLSHFSRVQLFATLWTIACQAPLSMGSSRQEYWSGLPCPPQEYLPNLGIQSTSLTSPVLVGGFFDTNITWEALLDTYPSSICICIFKQKIFLNYYLSHGTACGVLVP